MWRPARRRAHNKDETYEQWRTTAPATHHAGTQAASSCITISRRRPWTEAGAGVTRVLWCVPAERPPRKSLEGTAHSYGVVPGSRSVTQHFSDSVDHL